MSDWHSGKDLPWRRLILLSAVLCIVAIAAIVVARFRGPDTSDIATRCYNALFSGENKQALALLAQYREAATPPPAKAKDELFRLQAIPEFKLYTNEANEQLLQQTTFFCLASARAVGDAQTPPGAVMRIFRYVTREIQSEGITPQIILPAQHVLIRGRASQVEICWLMAKLLRYRGLHAAIVQLPQGDKPAYSLVAVLGNKRLFLFDPWRGVPILRADGAIANAVALASEEEDFAPGYGGADLPINADSLKSAVYLVPADADEILPDTWLLSDILRQNGRPETIYRSFRSDLMNIAAGVFGEGAPIEVDNFVALRAANRAETVLLWPYPFHAQIAASSPEYLPNVIEKEPAFTVYPGPRIAQVQGALRPAESKFEELLTSATEPQIIDDLTFFRAKSVEEAERKAEMLSDYLDKFPSGRWRPLATMILAENLLALGQGARAAELAATLEPPYDLKGKALEQAARNGETGLKWLFPE